MQPVLKLIPMTLGLLVPVAASALTISVNGEEVTVANSAVSFTNSGLSIQSDAITTTSGGGTDPQPVDSDGDGVADSDDNCPDKANSGQADNDQDGIGNVCDPTPDGGSGGGGELPDNAKDAGVIDLDNPPARDEKSLGSKIHVYTLKSPSDSSRWGNIKNNYTASSPEARRTWISASPAGQPLSGRCDVKGYEAATMWWTAGSTYESYGCNLEPNVTYYLNVSLESGTATEYYLTVNRY